MDSRIKIKMGAVEIEFEGNETFLKNEFLKLVSSALELYEKTSNSNKFEGVDLTTQQDDKKPPPKKPELQMTIGTICSKLKVNSGSDLIIAACSYYTLVEKKESFSRKEIITEMRKATGYFRNSYVGNVTPYLKTLLNDGKILETTTGIYSLSKKTRDELEKKLAE